MGKFLYATSLALGLTGCSTPRIIERNATDYQAIPRRVLEVNPRGTVVRGIYSNAEVINGRKIELSNPNISTEWYFDQDNNPEEAILGLDFDKDGQVDVRGVIDLRENSDLIPRAENARRKMYSLFPDPTRISFTEEVFRLPQSDGRITFYASEGFRNRYGNPQRIVQRSLPNITSQINFLPLE